jgi:hypothetical protein
MAIFNSYVKLPEGMVYGSGMIWIWYGMMYDG